ncbi:unnamed protein product [Acanthoscelides obtectus]|nr:unnamed protein product [Acanthoscelides obtectus]CAK1658162.1 hypothetical protein AOBTE_LOCUS20735 [Acanthoscelides obtectus]
MHHQIIMKGVIYFLPVLWVSVNCARILGIFRVPFLSHQVVYQPIWKELSLKGHQITIVTTHPLNEPELTNLTEIDVSEAVSAALKTTSIPEIMSKDVPLHSKIHKLFQTHYKIAEAVLSHPRFIEIYNTTNVSYDLVLAEGTTSPILYAVAAKFKVPLVGINSFGAWTGLLSAMGTPHSTSLYSETWSTFRHPMTFSERLRNTLHYIWTRY